MKRVRECKKACGYPALPGRQFCRWHALLRLSSIEQAQAAVARRQDVIEPPVGPELRARVPKNEWPAGERWCADCQWFIPLFYCSGSKCKAHASMAAHAGRVEKTYGISADEYDEILRRQGGRCAICRNVSRTIRFAVDHDHKTGEVRGLLCKRCNHDLLGGGHDSIDLLWNAIRYLLYPPAQYTQSETPSIEGTLVDLEAWLLAFQEANAPRLRIPVLNDPPPF